MPGSCRDYPKSFIALSSRIRSRSRAAVSNSRARAASFICASRSRISASRDFGVFTFGRASAATLYAGTNGNRSGVYKSTNGGKTFRPTGSALDNQVVWDIEEISGTLIAALNAGVARSTDGGATWQPANSGLPANTALYSLHDAGGVLVAGGVNGVYRSTNAGQSWTAGGTPSASSLHAVYSLAGSGSTLYAGVFDSAGGNHGVSKSLNGGLSWASATSGLPKSPVNALLETGGVLLAGTSSGLFVSTDGAASWRPYGRELKGTYVHSLAASDGELLVGTSKRGISRLPLRPRAQRLVPIVLDLYGAAPTHFTTELTLTNRGTTDAAVTMRYTAAIRSGSGNAAETVRAGQQLVIPDAIAYLIGKGVPIPPPSTSGGQGGTLLVTFDGISDEGVASVTARTATATSAPQPVGLAGLAYSGVDPALGSKGALLVPGLRSDATDRSNVAVYNTSEEPVEVRIHAFSGSGEGSPKIVADVSLPPWGWRQLNEVLQIGSPGITNGFVVAERTSSTGSFGACGVINDRSTGDGSYLLPVEPVQGLSYVNVPVLVENGAFESERLLRRLASRRQHRAGDLRHLRRSAHRLAFGLRRSVRSLRRRRLRGLRGAERGVHPRPPGRRDEQIERGRRPHGRDLAGGVDNAGADRVGRRRKRSDQGFTGTRDPPAGPVVPVERLPREPGRPERMGPGAADRWHRGLPRLRDRQRRRRPGPADGRRRVRSDGVPGPGEPQAPRSDDEERPSGQAAKACANGGGDVGVVPGFPLGRPTMGWRIP